MKRRGKNYPPDERYYIGSPCKYGHGKLRYTSNYTCVQCAAEVSKRKYEKVKKNKEAVQSRPAVLL